MTQLDQAFKLNGLIVPYLLDESLEKEALIEKERYTAQMLHS